MKKKSQRILPGLGTRLGLSFYRVPSPDCYDLYLAFEPAHDRDAAFRDLEMRGQGFDHGLVRAALLRRGFDPDPERPRSVFLHCVRLCVCFYFNRKSHVGIRVSKYQSVRVSELRPNGAPLRELTAVIPEIFYRGSSVLPLRSGCPIKTFGHDKSVKKLKEAPFS